jgi:hypothetical protein
LIAWPSSLKTFRDAAPGIPLDYIAKDHVGMDGIAFWGIFSTK